MDAEDKTEAQIGQEGSLNNSLKRQQTNFIQKNMDVSKNVEKFQRLKFQRLERLNPPIHTRKKKLTPFQQFSSKESKRILEEYKNSVKEKASIFNQKLTKEKIQELSDIERLQIDDAKKLYSQGHFEESLKMISNVLNSNSQCDPEAYFICGESLYKLGNYEDAIDIITSGLERNPFSARAYQVRGKCFVKIDQIESAEKEFEKYLKMEQQNPNVLVYLGKCKSTLGKLEEARDIFSNVLKYEEKRDDPYLYFLRGDVMHQMGLLEEARRDFDIVFTLDPSFHDSYEKKAAEEMERGDKESSVCTLISLIKMRPQELRYYWKCGNIYLESGDIEKAIEMLSSCLQILEENNSKKPQDNHSDSSEGQDQNSRDTCPDELCEENIRLTRGKIYLDIGKFDMASEDFSIVLRINPKNVKALELRAQTHTKQNTLSEAKCDYEKLVKMKDPSKLVDKGEAHLFLSNYYFDIEKDYVKSLENKIGAYHFGKYKLKMNVREKERMALCGSKKLALSREDPSEPSESAIVPSLTSRFPSLLELCLVSYAKQYIHVKDEALNNLPDITREFLLTLRSVSSLANEEEEAPKSAKKSSRSTKSQLKKKKP